VLRHGQQNAAAVANRAMHLPQHGLVVLDVLQDIEGPDHVELIDIRDIPGVHLEQIRPRQARLGERQALGVDFAAREPQGGKLPAEIAEHKTRAAADFQQRLRPRKVAAQRPRQQPIPGSEPEIARLHSRQTRKRLRLEPVVLRRQLRREGQETLARGRHVRALRTAPIGPVERLAACEATLQFGHSARVAARAAIVAGVVATARPDAGAACFTPTRRYNGRKLPSAAICGPDRAAWQDWNHDAARGDSAVELHSLEGVL